MKLSSADISNLKLLFEMCSIGDIESMIIEDGVARGVNDSRTMAIISDQNVPKLPQKVGLSRISGLKQKLALFATLSDVVVNAVESDRGEISNLEISSGRNKATYRCTSTMMIKAPKTINDTYVFAISMSSDEFKFIQNGIKMMGAKTVQLIIKKSGEVSFVANDSANDSFTATLNTPVEAVNSDHDTNVFYYHTDILLSVLRSLSGEIVFSVGEGGSICAELNGHTIYIMPKVGDDTED